MRCFAIGVCAVLIGCLIGVYSVKRSQSCQCRWGCKPHPVIGSVSLRPGICTVRLGMGAEGTLCDKHGYCEDLDVCYGSSTKEVDINVDFGDPVETVFVLKGIGGTGQYDNGDGQCVMVFNGVEIMKSPEKCSKVLHDYRSKVGGSHE